MAEIKTAAEAEHKAEAVEALKKEAENDEAAANAGSEVAGAQKEQGKNEAVGTLEQEIKDEAAEPLKEETMVEEAGASVLENDSNTGDTEALRKEEQQETKAEIGEAKARVLEPLDWRKRQKLRSKLQRRCRAIAAVEVRGTEMKMKVSKPQAADLTNQKAGTKRREIQVKENDRSLMGWLFPFCTTRAFKESPDHFDKIDERVLGA